MTYILLLQNKDNMLNLFCISVFLWVTFLVNPGKGARNETQHQCRAKRSKGRSNDCLFAALGFSGDWVWANSQLSGLENPERKTLPHPYSTQRFTRRAFFWPKSFDRGRTLLRPDSDHPRPLEAGSLAWGPSLPY